MRSRPTNLAIALALSMGTAYWEATDGFVPADVVRGQLQRLGFNLFSQSVVAELRAMEKTAPAWVESRTSRFTGNLREYRITEHARDEIHTRVRASVPCPWLPTWRGGGRS